MRRIGRISVAVLAAAAGAGCRVSVRDSDAAEAARAWARTDTVRATCAPADRRAPAWSRTAASGVRVDRLLAAGPGTWLVPAAGGLRRWADRRVEARSAVGKDWAVRGDTLVALERERIGFYVAGPDGRLDLARSVPAEKGLLSIAVGGEALWLHSPGDPAGRLVTRRDPRTGRVLAGYLPVERDLVRLLLTDPDRVLEDAGSLAADVETVAFVPAVRDPIVLLDPAAGRRTDLFLAGGARGEVRTVEERVLDRRAPACRGCAARRASVSRQRTVRLWAGAALEGGALWAVRLDPPGSTTAALVRVPREPAAGTIRAWRLPPLPAPARAMAVGSGRLVVATEDGGLWSAPLPAPATGARCAPGYSEPGSVTR